MHFFLSQGKIKKHQAFEAEIAANEDAIGSLNRTGEALINNQHFASEAISTRLSAVGARWEELKVKSQEKAQKLQDAQDLLLFRREADEVMMWISDKVAVASSKEVGKDLEHNEDLQKKFDDFYNDLVASEARIDTLNESALKLIGNAHPDQATIRNRQQVCLGFWEKR